MVCDKLISELRGEIKRLQTALSDLVDVADDLRCYTRDWDWKYGEKWDEEIDVARAICEMGGEAAEAVGGET